ASRRPLRDQPVVAQHPALGRTAPLLPQQAAVRGLQAVEMAVVADGEQAILPDRRGEPDRTSGEERPELPSGGRVERADRSVRGAADEDPAPCRYRNVRAVV